MPNDKYVWAFLGEAQMNQQKYAEAVASFKKSFEVDPSFIASLSIIAKTFGAPSCAAFLSVVFLRSRIAFLVDFA